MRMKRENFLTALACAFREQSGGSIFGEPARRLTAFESHLKELFEAANKGEHIEIEEAE